MLFMYSSTETASSTQFKDLNGWKSSEAFTVQREKERFVTEEKEDLNVLCQV